MSTNDLDFSRDLPPKPPPYPEPPDKPRSSGCGTCLIVFLIAFVILVAICSVGAYLVYQNLQAIGANIARETAVAMNYNPTGCNSVVAVITNQAQTAANPASCTASSYALSLSAPVDLDEKIYLPAILK